MRQILLTGAAALAMMFGTFAAHGQRTGGAVVICDDPDSCDAGGGDDGGLGGVVGGGGKTGTGGTGGTGTGTGGTGTGTGGTGAGSGTGTGTSASTPPTAAPPAVGNSVTLNFNNVPNVFSTYTEGDYRITLLSGSVVGGSYGAQNTRSLSVLGPLAAAYVPPAPGVTNTISLVRVDGGLFSVDSFFSVLGGSSGTNTTTVDGYLGGVLAGSSTTTSSAGGFAFAQPSGLAGNFTEARFTFSTTSSSSAFDNLTLTAAAAAPEPASWAMFIGGFGLVGAALRRRRAAVAFG